MINPIIQQKIQTKLTEIEKAHNVEILYAVESGSRAWGFESLDSDYDVRFIYKNEVSWYLTVLPRRDVIEIPIEDLMDYSGWDLRKSFFLMNKSNPVLFEWLKSPIVYKKNEKFYEIFTEIAKEYFSPIATIYHYLHMASRNYKEYLKRDLVKTKKYFYVLRPLLACKWVELKNIAPPMEFEILLDELVSDEKVKSEVQILLKRKRSGYEFAEEKKIECINEYIESSIEHFEAAVSDFNPAEKPVAEKMDLAFLQILNTQ